MIKPRNTKSLKASLMDAVGDDLVKIETALEDNLTPQVPLVKQIAGHILFAGGKRLRPLLALLAARICGMDSPRVVRFSTIFEFLHAATLLHDDLVDDATLRRGHPVAHKVFGNERAVLTGDFLLARSLSIAAETEKPGIIDVVAEITELMSQGEIEQLENRGRLDLTESEYLEVIRRKTAVLIQGACHTGALFAGKSGATASALKNYGFHLGMAFQMADDLLDYTADTDTLGKAVGADLREGKLTLPVIHALARADEADRTRMTALLGNQGFTVDEFKHFVTRLAAWGGIDYTREQAAAHVSRAKSELAIFAPSPTRAVLENIADYALLRQK